MRTALKLFFKICTYYIQVKIVNYCMYCKYANGVIAYRRVGKRKYEKEPVLWCEKHKKSVLCTEQHPCFIPDCIPPKK